MNSFYFWTEMRPPTSSTAKSWKMTLLDDPQQQAVVDSLRQATDLCIVRTCAGLPAWLGGDSDQGCPLDRYINSAFTNALSEGGYDIMVKTERLGRVPATLVEGELALDGAHDYWPLPPGLLRLDDQFVFSIRVKTTTSGVILGMQDGAFPPGPPTRWLPFLFLGDDGHLNIAVSASGNAVGRTEEVLTDRAWHRIEVAKLTADAVDVYVDGRLARSVQGLPPSPNLEYAQLGAGYCRGFVGTRTDWLYFAGRMADARLLTGDQCGRWRPGDAR